MNHPPRYCCQVCRQTFRDGETIDTDPLNPERWNEAWHRHLRIEQCVTRLAELLAPAEADVDRTLDAAGE